MEKSGAFHRIRVSSKPCRISATPPQISSPPATATPTLAYAAAAQVACSPNSFPISKSKRNLRSFSSANPEANPASKTSSSNQACAWMLPFTYPNTSTSSSHTTYQDISKSRSNTSPQFSGICANQQVISTPSWKHSFVSASMLAKNSILSPVFFPFPKLRGERSGVG